MSKLIRAVLAATLLLQTAIVEVEAQTANTSQLTTVYESLNSLEKATFGKSYSNDVLPTRLERLEKKLLGGKQTGGIKSRIDNLLLAAPEEATVPPAGTSPSKTKEQSLRSLEPTNSFNTIVPKPVMIHPADQTRLILPLPVRQNSLSVSQEKAPAPSRSPASPLNSFTAPRAVLSPSASPSPRPVNVVEPNASAQSAKEMADAQARENEEREDLKKGLLALKSGDIFTAADKLEYSGKHFLDNAAKISAMNDFTALGIRYKAQPDKALTAFYSAVSLNPQSPIAMANYKKAALATATAPSFQTAKVKEAMRLLKQWMDCESGKIQVSIFESMLIGAKAYLACMPNKAHGHGKIAEAQESLNNYGEAEAEYRKSISLSKGRNILREYSLDEILVKQGKPREYTDSKGKPFVPLTAEQRGGSKAEQSTPSRASKQDHVIAAPVSLSANSNSSGQSFSTPALFGNSTQQLQTKPDLKFPLPVTTFRPSVSGAASQATPSGAAVSTKSGVEATKSHVSTQPTLLNNEGVRLINAQKYDEAIQKLETALSIDPDYKMAKENLGIAYNNGGLVYQNDPDKAIVYFHKAAYLSPNNETTVMNLAGIITKLGKDPKDFNVRVQLGNKARMQSDLVGAIVEYNAAIKIKPDASVYKVLGDVYRVKDKNKEALAAYQEGSRLADSAMLEAGIGNCHLALGDISSALAAFQKAVALKPSDPDVQDSLLAGWEAAVQDKLSAPENHIGLGQAYRLKGDTEKAKAEFTQAKNLSPGKVNAGADQLLSELEGTNTVAASTPNNSGYQATTFLQGNSLGSSTSDTTISAQQSVDFGPYTADLQRRIKRAWFAPHGSEARNGKLMFKVHKDGHVTNIRMTVSSGLAIADQAFLKAIENAAPFRPLPNNASESVDWEATYSGTSDAIVLMSATSSQNSIAAPSQIGYSSDKKNLLFEPGVKTGANPNIDYGPYMADVQRTIKQNWKVQRMDDTKTVKVVFSVNQDGTIFNTQIINSSGSISNDSAALQAVAASSPLKALPPGTIGPIQMEFSFDVNVFKYGQLSEAKSIVEKASNTFRDFERIVNDGTYIDEDENFTITLQKIEKFPTKFVESSLTTKLRVKLDENGVSGFERISSSGNEQFDTLCINAIRHIEGYKPKAPFKTANLILRFDPAKFVGGSDGILEASIESADISYAYKSDEIITKKTSTATPILLTPSSHDGFVRSAPIVFLFRNSFKPSKDASVIYDNFARNNSAARFYYEGESFQSKLIDYGYVPAVYVFVEGRLCSSIAGLEYFSDSHLSQLLSRASEQMENNKILPVAPPGEIVRKYYSENRDLVIREYRPIYSSSPKAEFNTYTADLERRLRRAWSPSRETEVVVKFKIARDGQMTDLRVLNTAGVVDPLYLQEVAAARSAIANNAPFRPLPAEASGYVEVTYTFKKEVKNPASGFRHF